MQIFSTAEYRERIRRTKARMAEQGLDLLLTSSPENLNYLSGYAGWSFYTPQVLLLAIDADEPLLILRRLDLACAELTAVLSSDHVLGYSEAYVDSPDKHPMSFVVDAIKERGWCGGALGIEMDAFYLTPRAFATLKRSLPTTRIVDAGPLVNWVRLVKSDTEIELLRQSGTIASRAMKVAIERIASGVRQCDVAAQVYAAQIAGTPEFGGGVPMGLVISAGDKTRAPHLSWTDDPFQDDQPINLELGGSRFQYHCGIARSVYIGTPPRGLVQLADTVIKGINAALNMLRPGATCEDVANAWNRVIDKAGYSKDSRIGYSIGLGFQPIWIEGTASLRGGDKTKLQPDMVFHVICGMWHGEYNFVVSETARVTEHAHELLTHVDRRLFTKS